MSKEKELRHPCEKRWKAFDGTLYELFFWWEPDSRLKIVRQILENAKTAFS